MGTLFTALAFDQSGLGLHQVLRVTDYPFGVKSLRLLALAQHQGVNVGLVLILYQLLGPMRGPVLVKSSVYSQQGENSRAILGPLVALVKSSVQKLSESLPNVVPTH